MVRAGQNKAGELAQPWQPDSANREGLQTNLQDEQVHSQARIQISKLGPTGPMARLRHGVSITQGKEGHRHLPREGVPDGASPRCSHTAPFP